MFFEYIQKLQKSDHVPPVWMVVCENGDDARGDLIKSAEHILSKNDHNPEGMQHTFVEKMMRAGTYPNFFEISKNITDDKSTDITVDQIRKFKTFLQTTPAVPGWRVAIIFDADTMNRNAANALLKSLEEPPKKTFLVLQSKSLGTILPTIRSRCQIYNTHTLSENGRLVDPMWAQMAEQFAKSVFANRPTTANVLTSIDKSPKKLQSFTHALLTAVYNRFQTIDSQHKHRLLNAWHGIHDIMLKSEKTHLDPHHILHAYVLALKNEIPLR